MDSEALTSRAMEFNIDCALQLATRAPPQSPQVFLLPWPILESFDEAQT